MAARDIRSIPKSCRPGANYHLSVSQQGMKKFNKGLLNSVAGASQRAEGERDDLRLYAIEVARDS